MPIMSIPGLPFSMRDDALRWLLRMVVDGCPLDGINSAYRPLSEQIDLFLSRYARTNDPLYKGPFGDHRYWLGNGWYYRTSPAGPVAVPGTSKHTDGTALDIATRSRQQAWMVANAHKYGFRRTLWDAYRLEPWHYEWAAKWVQITPDKEGFTVSDVERIIEEIDKVIDGYQVSMPGSTVTALSGIGVNNVESVNTKNASPYSYAGMKLAEANLRVLREVRSLLKAQPDVAGIRQIVREELAAVPAAAVELDTTPELDPAAIATAIATELAQRLAE